MNQLFKQYFFKIASPYRLLGYICLFAMVLIYHNQANQWQMLSFIFAVFLALYFCNQPLQKMVAKHNLNLTRYVSFGLDVIVFFLALWLVDFNFILSSLGLVGLFYILVYKQRNTEYLLIFILLTLICLALTNIMEFQQHLNVMTPTTFILYILVLSIFIFSGMFAQTKRLSFLEEQNQAYYQQMIHYMDFSNQISRYAPAQLWQAIMRGESEAKIEYKRKKLTIFFSDIQGFTQLSETLIPEDLAYLLNEYLRQMTQIARQYNGTIDKFMGDGILIFFGDIDSQGLQNDAKACLNMALAMQQQMKILRERWKKMGYPALHIRMGISTGYCHVGNYGTADRMAYTIVGREANLAARIQSQAEIDEILVSDSTYQLIFDEFLCIEKPTVLLKGIQEPIRTWQIFERYEQQAPLNVQKSFDFEAKGFNLLLDLDEIERQQYPEVLETLDKMMKRIQMQQELTNENGVVELRKEDETHHPD